MWLGKQVQVRIAILIDVEPLFSIRNEIHGFIVKMCNLQSKI